MSQSNSIRMCLALGVLILSGCAAKPSVSQFQCQAGDWQTIGYRDGTQGLASTELLRHQEACGAYAIVPDRQVYLQGWEQGVQQYCTADNAFRLGKQGARRNAICTTPAFALAYREGRQLYEARVAVNRLAQQLDNMSGRLAGIEQEIIGASTAQLQPDLTAQERLGLIAKVKNLVTEREQIKTDMPLIEQDLADSQRHLEQLTRQYELVSLAN